MTEATTPDAAPDTTTTEAPDATTTEADPGNPPDLAALQAELASVKSTLENLGAEKAESDAKAEAARVAALTADERLAELTAKLTADVEAERAALAGERQKLIDRRRTDALTRMGFDERLHALAPQVDPDEPEGGAALETWGKAHADMAKAPASAPVFVPKPKSPLARVLSGETRNPLITEKSLGKMFGGS